MGSCIGPIFNALYHDVLWLHMRWNQYRLLYGEKPERIDMLNEAAPVFFRLLQDTLWEQTLLDISRLNDPAQQGKNGKYLNLSLEQLAQSFPSDSPLKAITIERLRDVRNAAAFAVDWRNRRIAHRELNLALQRPVRPLTPGSRLKVEMALSRIDDLMNEINKHYLDSTIIFAGMDMQGDATQLLYRLRDGIQAEREMVERMRVGRPTEADINRPPI
jgi:hypothetical protein